MRTSLVTLLMASVKGRCLGQALTQFWARPCSWAPQSGYCDGSGGDRLGGGDEFNFDVVAEAIEALHEFAFGQVGEIAAQEVGDLGLGKAHEAASFFLSDREAADGASDLHHQTRFDLELFGVGQIQIAENIPG